MNDEDFRALVEQSHQLHQLTEHPGWAVLVDYMSVVMNPAKRTLLNGNAESYESYKGLSSFCVGVHRVLDAHDEIGKQVDRERERRKEAQADSGE